MITESIDVAKFSVQTRKDLQREAASSHYVNDLCNVDNISMFSFNVFGNLSLKLKNPDFVNLICKHDVVFLNECWLSHTSFIELDSYTCFTKVRKKRRGAKRDSGWICILLSNKLVNQFDIENWNLKMDSF